jgi:DeoR/GlpR family transcriptional regulator of sugar metabolism
LIILNAWERRKAIVSMLQNKETARVSSLSKRFQVTNETIRRDLETLESEGVVERVHGGARAIKSATDELPFIKKEIEGAEIKRKIASQAVNMINGEEIIGLDSSDLSYQVSKALPNINLTVITNSVPVTLECLKKDRIKTITVGGYADPHTMAFYGTMAEKFVRTYHVDKFFFSCKGFHADHGIYENNEMDALVKESFIGISEKLILLAESTQFGHKSLTSFCKMSEISQLIIDHRISVNSLTALKSKGILVQIAN